MVFTREEKQFAHYIKAVGTGPKGNRDLTFQESYEMMRMILAQEVHPENLAAFLLGWRLKPETIEEFRGALSAMDSFVIKQNIPQSIELGYPFDGKAKNPYIFPFVADLLQKSELALVIMGDTLQPAKGGITTQDIAHNSQLSKNIHYFDREDYSPALHKLTEVRMRLALRSAFNTLEKLPHITNASSAITGVHHKPYVKKYQEIFASRYERFALIQGNEGTPELFNKGKLWLSHNNSVEEYSIDPAYYGINIPKSLQKITLEDSLAFIKNPPSEFLALAKLNAALLIFVSSHAESLDNAYESLA